MTEARLIYITATDRVEALKIGRELIERKLCNCINVLDGMTSIYRWEGQVKEDQEAVLIAKTTPALADAVIAAVKEVHSYSLPCALVLPVLGGNPDYLKWLADR